MFRPLFEFGEFGGVFIVGVVPVEGFSASLDVDVVGFCEAVCVVSVAGAPAFWAGDDVPDCVAVVCFGVVADGGPDGEAVAGLVFLPLGAEDDGSSGVSDCVSGVEDFVGVGVGVDAGVVHFFFPEDEVVGPCVAFEAGALVFVSVGLLGLGAVCHGAIIWHLWGIASFFGAPGQD